VDSGDGNAVGFFDRVGFIDDGDAVDLNDGFIEGVLKGLDVVGTMVGVKIGIEIGCGFDPSDGEISAFLLLIWSVLTGEILKEINELVVDSFDAKVNKKFAFEYVLKMTAMSKNFIDMFVV